MTRTFTVLAVALAVFAAANPALADARRLPALASLQLRAPALGGGGDASAPAPFDAGTIALQVLTGTLAAGIGGSGGFILGAWSANDGGDGWAALGMGLVGMMAGAALAVGPGVWLGGWARGHEGSLGWTTLAAVGGAAATLVMAAMFGPISLPIGALAFAGVIATYHSTDEEMRRVAVLPAASAPIVRRAAADERTPSLPRASGSTLVAFAF